jgi:hypothetical protein
MPRSRGFSFVALALALCLTRVTWVKAGETRVGAAVDR